MRSKPVDRIFFWIVIILALSGLLIFVSASLGLLARSGARFSDVAVNQFVAIGIGSLFAFAAARIRYTFWRHAAFYIFLASVALTLLVFLPAIGLEFGGGKRWLALGGFTLQPAEFLKIGFVMYCAAWLSAVKEKVAAFHNGLLPIVIMLAIVGAILLKQPDTDTFISIFVAAAALFFISGGRFRHIFVIALISVASFALLVFSRPYLLERFNTFLNPAADRLNAGYHIQQSLIAVGSGEILGRGFGQSTQKFSYLPEPIGDSIFAVAAEEFGFVGAATLVLLFVFFTLRGLSIAARAPDLFGGLLAAGIVILIVSGSFMNIASMLGLIPLSGLPLSFVSHGGSAMVFTLFEVGILLNISRYRK